MVDLRPGQGRQHLFGVTGAQVPRERGVVEDASVGRQVALPHDDPHRLVVVERAVGSAGGQLRVVGQRRAGADEDGPAAGPLEVDVGPGGLPGDPPARPVRCGAAPVEGRGELPGHPGTAGDLAVGPGAVQRLRLVGQQAALDRDTPLAQPTRRLRRRPGWGRSGRARRGVRPRHTTPAAHGWVRPVWLHGSKVTYAVAPAARSPAWASASGSAWGVPAPRCQPSPTTVTVGRDDHGAHAGVGVRLGDRWPPGPGRAASSPHRCRRGCRSCVCHVLPSCSRWFELRGTMQADHEHSDGQADRGTHWSCCRVLPTIRTFTVGLGVPPSQPAAGCGRVADCHRRFGVTPTPEHVPLSMPASPSRPERRSA